MASRKHLSELKQSVDSWGLWRREHPKIVPDLSRADLRQKKFRGAKLGGANLSSARLNGADLREADLRGADLSEADLRDAQLSDADLRGANLTGASLGGGGPNLLRANLRGASLRGSNLLGAYLCDADLREADLSGADLGSSVLLRAKLNGAWLTAANLRSADLTNADLTDAHVDSTLFVRNDLRSTKGLQSLQHDGPSTIDLDTIYRSEGRIPLAFLRGAGLPDNFIEYMPSLVSAAAVQFYSCFISYSTKDQQFADRLFADLQSKGVRCWFAPHDVQGGKKLHEQIDNAIRVHEKLLLILSPNSMASKWVETEIRNARNRELAEGKRVLFPVRLTPWEEIKAWKLFNADEGRDLATEIREYYIPDFSDWKNHDPYHKEFEKLLRDLRTDVSK